MKIKAEIVTFNNRRTIEFCLWKTGDSKYKFQQINHYGEGDPVINPPAYLDSLGAANMRFDKEVDTERAACKLSFKSGAEIKVGVVIAREEYVVHFRLSDPKSFRIVDPGGRTETWSLNDQGEFSVRGEAGITKHWPDGGVEKIIEQVTLVRLTWNAKIPTR